MVKPKVKLQYIENNKPRKVSYHKRIKGLVKLTQELSVLCGIDNCTVVYGPYDPSPVVWPSSELEARRILLDYKRRPDMDQTPWKLDQEAYLKQRVAKSQEKLSKLQRRNLESDMENVMSDLLSGRPIEKVPFGMLRDLMWVIDDKLRTVHRIRNFGNPGNALIPGANHSLIDYPVGNEMVGGFNTVMGQSGIGNVPFHYQAGLANLSQFQAAPTNLSGLSNFQAGPYNCQYQPEISRRG